MTTILGFNWVGPLAQKPVAEETRRFDLFQPAGLDNIRFSGKKQPTAEQKLAAYAMELLTQAQVKPGQKVSITANSINLPLVRKMVEAAYRDFKSGVVSVSLKEPQLEALKTKYGITEQFDFVALKNAGLKAQGAAFLTLDENANHYEKAGLTKLQARRLTNSMVDDIPAKTRNLLKIEPDDMLDGCLNLKPGQPLRIYGEREHLPQIVSLVERAYEKGTRLVHVTLGENKRWNLEIPFYQYASDEALTEVSGYSRPMLQEFLDKNAARVYLDGEDPALYEGVDPARISKSSSAQAKAVKDLRERMTSDLPWCIYYAPTTVSAKAAGYDSLKDAAVDARKINRVGSLKEHIANLQVQTDKINALVKEGFRTIRFVSYDPETGKPDGKTNLKVGLTPKSFFMSALMKTPSGQEAMANVPSEESFSTPDWTKTEGVATMTRPISINGNLIEGIRMEFENGVLAKDADGNYKVDATKNKQVLLDWLKENENADKLGEVALVADSPIFHLGRVFNSILLDENATCHMALGSSYAECVEGANDIADFEQKQAYLKSLNCNDSTTHYDFMIGGPNVKVTFETEDGSQQKTVIENNKFQL